MHNIVQMSYKCFAFRGFGLLIADGPLVTTRCGTLRGVYSGMSDDVQDVCVFYNIPFAAPPVGNLRFKPPERAEPWEGIRDASRPGFVFN